MIPPVWFNPCVADDDTSRTGGALRRRPSLVWLVGAAVVLLGLGAGTLIAARRSSPEDVTLTALPPPLFVDDSAGAGITHRYTGAFEFFVGGGVAVLDCDDDGREDLYVAGGTSPAALYVNRSPVGGELSFAPLASPVTDLTEVTGAYPLDLDSDGYLDLVVLRRGANVVLRGLGDCRFEDAGQALAFDGGDDWTTAFSATWEAGNTLPTLAFGNYLTLDRVECGVSTLMRPADDHYGDAAPLAPGYCPLSALFSDWGRSGQRDLRLTNDRHYYTDGEDQLWRIAPGEPPAPYTADDGWRSLVVWGMGIASRDLTGDGHPEVFVTSQGDNKLQTLADEPSRPTYTDMALRAGVTAQRPHTGGDVLPSTAWHPEFEDVNNDGLVDLFVAKGNVEAQPDHAMRDPNNLLIGQPDGTFVEGAEAAGIVTFERGRGAALVDLNLDGMLDIVVVNREAPPSLWRNVGAGVADDPAPMGRWIAVRLAQPSPNVDAVGAWLDVRIGDRTMTREVTVGGGHAGGKAGWIHTGIGGADDVEARVHWPDGETGPWMTVRANSFVTIERGAAEPEEWTPPD
jgi:enediyne biosynthesis protein E4